jgi:hypothetical protein
MEIDLNIDLYIFLFIRKQKYNVFNYGIIDLLGTEKETTAKK